MKEEVVSRIGKKPIDIPQGVRVKIAENTIEIEGQKGKLEFSFSPCLKIEEKNNQILVKRESNSKLSPTTFSEKFGHSRKVVGGLHGLTRSLIANMIEGVTKGYEKRLEIRGVGYRAQVKGRELTLNLGFSHPVNFSIPEGITIEVPSPTQIVVKGIDKKAVGEVAAQIRNLRPPESYKGKGIRYIGEYVRQKQGKKVA